MHVLVFNHLDSEQIIRTHETLEASKLPTQTINVVQTRAKYFGIDVIVGKTDTFNFGKKNLAGALVQYPDTFGLMHDFSDVAKKLHDNKAYLCVAADPLNLMISRPPSEMVFRFGFLVL